MKFALCVVRYTFYTVLKCADTEGLANIFDIPSGQEDTAWEEYDGRLQLGGPSAIYLNAFGLCHRALQNIWGNYKGNTKM